MSSDYLGARHQSFVSSELFYLQDNAIGMGYLNLSRSGLTYHKAGFVKLREVSLGYNVPDALAERLGASSARNQRWAAKCRYALLAHGVSARGAAGVRVGSRNEPTRGGLLGRTGGKLASEISRRPSL